MNHELLTQNIANVGIPLGQLLQIDDLWHDRVTAPLAGMLATNPSLATIVADLNTAIGDTVFFVEQDSLTEKSLRFRLTADHFLGGVPTHSGSINLGPGNTLSAGGTFTFTGDLDLGGVIGIDLNQGADFTKALFLRDVALSLGGVGNLANVNANVNLGPVTAGVQNGSFGINVQVDVELKNPDTNGDHVTLDYVIDSVGKGTVGDLIDVTPVASLHLNLPLNLTNSSTNFSLSDWGQPVVRASSQNLFSSAPDIVVDIALTNNLQDQILAMLGNLDAAAENISNRPFLNQEIPGIGQSLNELLNEGGLSSDLKWGDLIKFQQAAEDYLGTFDPSSIHFNPALIGQHPSVLGLRDAITTKIQQAFADTFRFGADTAP